MMTKQATDLLGPIPHNPGGRLRVQWPADSTITARFSACDLYRYELREVWNPAGPLWLWLMMNPSVAGLQFSDMTIQKTGRISRLGGAGGQIIANTGAYRSTSPAGLFDVADPVGPDNEATILRLARLPEVARVVLAYGQPPKPLAGQGARLAGLLHEAGIRLHVLRLSQDGTPMHPLSRGRGFIPVETALVEWVPGQTGGQTGPENGQTIPSGSSGR